MRLNSSRAWVAFLGLTAACSVPTNHTSDPTANFVKVSDGIYRGARPNEAAVTELSQLGIRSILNLEDDLEAVREEKTWVDGLGVVQFSQPMSGTATPDNAQMSETLGIMADPTVRPIFVHCMKGMDRTGVVIALHRVFNEGWSAEDANREMHDRGFNTILIALEDYFENKSGL